MQRLCLVGLGNPGAKYRGTRHNVGFEWVEALSSSAFFSKYTFRFQEKFQSHWADVDLGHTEVHFLLPQTFMNESGRAVRDWKAKFQGDSKIIAIYDEMDIAVGKMRYRTKGSDGGHRGMRSIIECLGTQEVPRLRIGIGRPSDTSIDHVLTKFLPEERTVLNRLLADSQSQFEVMLSGDDEQLMNVLNAKNYAE